MEDLKDLLKDTRKHLMTGVSYMIPVVVAGGMILAISVILSGKAAVPKEGFLGDLASIGKAGLQLYVPIMSAYIAYSMVDRPGITPGIIGGLISMNIGAGFIGAMLAGLLAGILVHYLKKLNLPAPIRPLLPIMIIPIISVVVIGGMLYWVIGAPLASLTASLTNALNGMQSGSRAVLGLILAGMTGFDFGGPINKTAVLFGNGALAQGIYGPRAWLNIGTTAPALAMILATKLAPHKYTKAEKTSAPAVFLMGLCGITEGVIPYAVNDPLKVIPATVIGSAIGGAVAAALNVANHVPWGGLIVLPAIDNRIGYVIAIVIAAFSIAIIMNFLKKPVEEE